SGSIQAFKGYGDLNKAVQAQRNYIFFDRLSNSSPFSFSFNIYREQELLPEEGYVIAGQEWQKIKIAKYEEEV
ncbi:hypothetical protein D3H28_002573, partial [Listeria monocytogenes]